ncbi:MAG TPA: glycosyltransferase family 9 protein [Pirellulales bacterium]|nr:glycosyltransferase family 9 protein [Pirellulales bacterium]
MLSVETPRILICRMSAIGDTILTLPVACALRRQYPRAYIAWAVERGASPMVMGHACLDEVIVLKRGWFVSPKQWWLLRQRLKPLRIEVAVDCQSITKTALAAWLSGAKLRIGCKGKYGCELSPLLNNHLIEPSSPHLTDRSLELLAPLGIHSPQVEFQLPVAAAAMESANGYLREMGLDRGFALINPGATWNSKLWVMERFGEVACHLGRRHGLPSLVVWGGENELNWAREIVAHSDGHARLARKTSLPELAAICRAARIFIGSDTGPLHMAVAVGTPSVGIYGATRPEDCGPYGPQNIALQERYHDGSRKERRLADNSAMRLVQVDQVCGACDTILSRPKELMRGQAA